MRRNRSLERRIAKERMEILMQLAEEAFHGDRMLARRYVELARRIGMKYNLRFPRRWKRRFCRRCGAFLVPGANLRVRCRKMRVIFTCMECGAVRRVPYAREKLQKRLQTLHHQP